MKNSSNPSDNHGNQTHGHYNQRPHHFDRNKNKQQSNYQGNRDKSGQRERSGNNQHPDSSMGHDRPVNRSSGDGSGQLGPVVSASCAQYNLGAVKFSPGSSTKELPPIETKLDGTKKFSGRCRLFVGNLPHNTSEEKLRKLFDRFGEVGEVYLGPKSAYAFIKMDSRQSAEAARDGLDCTAFEGRSLRVRLAAHAAAIRIKNLSSQVTNELLAYAFRYFGEIERAVIVVDDKGKSVGEGIVEYSKKQSALFAVKRCQQECFFLTSSPMPVHVEPYDQQDDDEGLPEKSINKHSKDFQDQREVGPRFAEQGSFEHTYGLRWKELYALEKQKRDNLELELEEARKALHNQIEVSRLDHDTIVLKNQLRKLEENKIRLQQLKDEGLEGSQMDLRPNQPYDHMAMGQQRNDDVIRRQQMGSFTNNSSSSLQESTLRMQAGALQDLLSQKNDQSDSNSKSFNGNNNNNQSSTSDGIVNPDVEPVAMHPMMGAPIPSIATTYSEPSMVGIAQPPYITVHPSPTTMSLHQQQQQHHQGMFSGYIQPGSHQMQMPIDTSGMSTMIPAPTMAGFGIPSGSSTNRTSYVGGGGYSRQTTYSKQYRSNNNDSQSVISKEGHRGGAGHNGRPRKRGKY